MEGLSKNGMGLSGKSYHFGHATKTGPKRVLIVEDDLFAQMQVCMMLERISSYFGDPIQVSVANGLSDASNILQKKSPETPPFDLVLTDNNLEDKNDGLLLRKLFESKYPETLFVLTSGEQMQDFLGHLENGINSIPYISKLQNKGTYLHELKSYLYSARVRPHPSSTSLKMKKFISKLTLDFKTIHQFIFIMLGVFLCADLFESYVLKSKPFLIDTAPFIRAFKSRLVQHATRDLLNGGLTPLVRDPDFIKRQYELTHLQLAKLDGELENHF